MSEKVVARKNEVLLQHCKNVFGEDLVKNAYYVDEEYYGTQHEGYPNQVGFAWTYSVIVEFCNGKRVMFYSETGGGDAIDVTSSDLEIYEDTSLNDYWKPCQQPIPKQF